MKAEKWNYSNASYEECTLPDECDTAVNNVIVCANCHKEFPILVAYKSYEFRRLNGTRLPVCTDCFDVENTRRQIYYGNY